MVGPEYFPAGSQFTTLALPLTAVLLLKASPTEMGILGAVQYLPFLMLTLFAGGWVDRLKRRPLLIWTDLGQLVLLGSVPVAAWLGLLNMGYLYIIGLTTGILSVFFEVASQALSTGPAGGRSRHVAILPVDFLLPGPPPDLPGASQTVSESG